MTGFMDGASLNNAGKLWYTSRKEYIVTKSQVSRSGNAWKRSQRNHCKLYDLISQRNAPRNVRENKKSTYSPVHRKKIKINEIKRVAETGVQYVVSRIDSGKLTGYKNVEVT